MAYQTISPQCTLKFREMAKPELLSYYKWFMDCMPERIAALQDAINGTIGFENLILDLTPESLVTLGNWFAIQVETRKRTLDECAEIFLKAPDWFQSVAIEDFNLTNKTFSIAIDIGMYLSLVFLKNNSTLKWHHIITGSKKNVDYGQPVIEGFGQKVFNPVRVTIAMAYGIARKTHTGARLPEIYNIWVQYIKS